MWWNWNYCFNTVVAAVWRLIIWFLAQLYLEWLTMMMVMVVLLKLESECRGYANVVIYCSVAAFCFCSEIFSLLGYFIFNFYICLKELSNRSLNFKP